MELNDPKLFILIKVAKQNLIKIYSSQEEMKAKLTAEL